MIRTKPTIRICLLLVLAGNALLWSTDNAVISLLWCLMTAVWITVCVGALILEQEGIE